MDATTVAVDLGKDVFEVARANRAGRAEPRLSRICTGPATIVRPELRAAASKRLHRGGSEDPQPRTNEGPAEAGPARSLLHRALPVHHLGVERLRLAQIDVVLFGDLVGQQ